MLLARGTRLEECLFDLPCHRQLSNGQNISKTELWREGFSSVSAAGIKYDLKKVIKPVFLYFSPLCLLALFRLWATSRTDYVELWLCCTCDGVTVAHEGCWRQQHWRVLLLSLCDSGVVHPLYLLHNAPSIFFLFIILSGKLLTQRPLIILEVSNCFPSFTSCAAWF